MTCKKRWQACVRACVAASNRKSGDHLRLACAEMPVAGTPASCSVSQLNRGPPDLLRCWTVSANARRHRSAWMPLEEVLLLETLHRPPGSRETDRGAQPGLPC